ncbi:ABC transporter substrate-binding protein [Microbacterium imperiale]|uniref:ABC transporter substrate-binding protein n=1 Tax=Microbacterium imperiale TaxID=33884 RepID=UPI001AE1D809|nr:ABC transporter substrate-binding protein [Microbacterium imperiale]MBP2421099.1 peptide/nickel transport system substrate-binding protein [Microbacterium imperiale]MDS0199789.1 ABC transporter substrate-binding protein [Microbacterium imperiale]BFE41439.1 ABC transporter substrate-binding protein [Microbacterium imperiale]
MLLPPSRSRVLATVASAGAALLLVSCSSTTAGSRPSASDEPVTGGSLTFAISVDSQCIDPQQVSNNDAIAIARQTVASLTTQDPDTGEILPWLAESFDVNDDATRFTFTLRDGATYADGAPIDAASVRTNFEAITALGAKAPLGSSYLADLASIDVVDERTVTIAFSRPSAQFLQATSTFSLGLLSPATASVGQAQRCGGEFAGSGPFSVESYTPNEGATLVRRDGYDWGPSTNAHTGEAYLDSIEFVVVPEAGNRTGSLQSGQIDATTGISATDAVLFEGDGFWSESRANPGVVYNLYANQSTPKLADPDVRLAIQKGIDREEITATLLGPADKPAVSPLASSTPYFTDLGDVLEYDPDAAAALLDEAGWAVGSDGIREKDGERLSFSVTYWQSPKEVLELVQQQLREIGVDLQLTHASIADSQAASADGTYDFVYGNLTRSDPDVLRTVFTADNPTGNTRRTTRTAVDDLLDEQSATTDAATRQRIVDEAARALVTEGITIPIYELSTTITASARVRGLAFEASSRLDFADAWIAE